MKILDINFQIKNKKSFADYLIYFGVVVLTLSAFVTFLIFFPIIKNELLYLLSDKEASKKVVSSVESISKNSEEIIPADMNFSVVIPKINANAKVIKNIDPNNPKDYQRALSQGVAHAKGSSLPDEEGNVFLFAHSSDNFYNANRYNSVFYLINKLGNGDEFDIVYENKIYNYTVVDKKIVTPDNIRYINDPEMPYETVKNIDKKSGRQSAVLMSCWPPGTTINRIIIIGQLEGIRE